MVKCKLCNKELEKNYTVCYTNKKDHSKRIFVGNRCLSEATGKYIGNGLFSCYINSKLKITNLSKVV